MGYNNGRGNKELESMWDRLREEYRAAGMGEDAIREMIAFDKQCRNRDRKFYEHIQYMDFRKADGEVGENQSKSYHRKFKDSLQEEARITDPARRYGWVDELDSENLVNAVRSLSEKDMELITLLAYREKTEEEIAEMWGVSQQAISQRRRKIRKILKKF